MKISIAIAIVISLFMLAPSAQAQHAKKHYMHRTVTTVRQSDTTGGVPISSAGAEVSGVTGSAPGDPYNLAHPYFQGDPRWTDANQLYMHGDFPWALVSQHPDNFRFNASSGQWEVSSTANLGKTK
ncbi:MAG TPA: hypothetical protein VFH95_11155 [Candidatus Kapabacteria bacterium]|nr:hypothetical protein [Candidatus Kapabacteria bacterium]